MNRRQFLEGTCLAGTSTILPGFPAAREVSREMPNKPQSQRRREAKLRSLLPSTGMIEIVERIQNPSRPWGALWKPFGR